MDIDKGTFLTLCSVVKYAIIQKITVTKLSGDAANNWKTVPMKGAYSMFKLSFETTMSFCTVDKSTVFIHN